MMDVSHVSVHWFIRSECQYPTNYKLQTTCKYGGRIVREDFLNWLGCTLLQETLGSNIFNHIQGSLRRVSVVFANMYNIDELAHVFACGLSSHLLLLHAHRIIVVTGASTG